MARIQTPDPEKNLFLKSLWSFTTYDYDQSDFNAPSLQSTLFQRNTSNLTNKTLQEQKNSNLQISELGDVIKNFNNNTTRTLTAHTVPKSQHDASLVRKHICQIVGPELCHVCIETKERRDLSKMKIPSKENTDLNLIEQMNMMSKSLPAIKYETVATVNSKERNLIDSKKILAMVVKNKYGFKWHEDEIETMFNDGVINTKIIDLSNDITDEKPTVRNRYDKDGNYIEMTKDVQKKLTLPTIFDNIEELGKFQVTEYYFQNIHDLQQKLFLTKNKKLLLSNTCVPSTSNKLFLNLDRFEVHQKYNALAQKNKKLNSYLQKTKQFKIKSTNNDFEKLEFVSMKKFHIPTTKFKQHYEPSMVQLKTQRLNRIYDKRNSILNRIDYKDDFSVINRKIPDS